MVETAVFSIFHRAPRAEPPPPPAPVPVQPSVEAAITGAAGLPEPLPPPAPAEAPPEPVAEPALPEPALAAAEPVVDPVKPEPVAEPVAPEPEPEPAVAAAEPPAPASQEDGFADEAFISGVEASHELLGLANPEIVNLSASLPGSHRIGLSAEGSGIYRPSEFRAAPWSGFAYDQTPDGRTGLAAGTRILTARGEIPVEGLLPGDVALALRGPALLPIAWIGRSAANEPPILIERGALGPDRPRRALCLAADHPVFLDPVPVPARNLINGTTIRTTGQTHAELFHVDVGASEVLFAEGIPLSSGQRLQSFTPQ